MCSEPETRLLVLDNCEHLVEPIAELAERILRATPRVSIVATVAVPLAVMGEHVRPVAPLPVDDLDATPFAELAGVPAVALFLERARAADPDFEWTEQNAPAVVEICRRLDGTLALELAASRAKAIDVTEIASRLDERFRLLKGIRRGADPRHRTLQDAIGWSYELLDDDEKRVFAFAVFAGQFDLDAAESISSDEDDVLTMSSHGSPNGRCWRYGAHPAAARDTRCSKPYASRPKPARRSAQRHALRDPCSAVRRSGSSDRRGPRLGG